MTEADWLACRDPDALLEFLRGEAVCRRRSQPSRRRLRLFACACCRRAWPFLADERSRRAVEAAERYADRLATRQELAKVYAEAKALAPIGNAGLAAAIAAGLSGSLARAAVQAALAVEIGRWEVERAAQCGLIRDIFGNPFRPVPFVPAEWLSWDHGAIPALARSIYAARAFDRLSFLADALEKAGCIDAALLGHCRSGGEHVRGCWPLDLLLRKE